jgi:hypothetical protein
VPISLAKYDYFIECSTVETSAPAVASAVR